MLTIAALSCYGSLAACIMFRMSFTHRPFVATGIQVLATTYWRWKFYSIDSVSGIVVPLTSDRGFISCKQVPRTIDHQLEVAK